MKRIRSPLSALRKPRRPNSPAQPVHFHRGPQGQETPCFDRGCTAPALSVYGFGELDSQGRPV